MELIYAVTRLVSNPLILFIENVCNGIVSKRAVAFRYLYGLLDCILIIYLNI